MSSNATDLQNRLILAVERKYPKSRVWRQNVGSAYPIQTFKRAFEFIVRGITPPWFRPVQYGVVGSGDVGGWIHINGVAVVCHIEVKIGKDTQREAQAKFEATVKRCGGIYVIAHDLEGGMAALAEAVTALRSTS
jgi:hypothetical protein